jgi:hypothetical protein
LDIKYKGGALSSSTLRITATNAPTKQHSSTSTVQSKWRFGLDSSSKWADLNLCGAVRTLDHKNGRVPLDNGLLSRSGWTVIDDSHSFLLPIDEHSWVRERPERDTAKDVYIFWYASNYQQMLDEFVALSGNVPLLPRYSLGNWYSRWWEFSHDQVVQLIERFAWHDIPLSVMVLDMDWHLVHEPSVLTSNGWTGYTWNTRLFPDPKALIVLLKQRGIRVTLNLHPADGVHCHEAAYRTVAVKLGIDPESRNAVRFCCTDRRYIDAYFTDLHHPIERDGVEFWWIDWQHGRQSDMPSVDPLFWLNHLHSLDMERPNHPACTNSNSTNESTSISTNESTSISTSTSTKRLRRLILSRWGGLGNHRYPIGFSGDTHTTWESLRYQPYMTQTSSNVCFGWWSHDIGGFGVDGSECEELYIRWVQLGVFSPILRLHSMKVHVLQSTHTHTHTHNKPLSTLIGVACCIALGCHDRTQALGLGCDGATGSRTCHASATHLDTVSVHHGSRVPCAQPRFDPANVLPTARAGPELQSATTVLVRLAAALCTVHQRSRCHHQACQASRVAAGRQMVPLPHW